MSDSPAQKRVHLIEQEPAPGPGSESERLFEQVYRTYGPSLYRFCLLQMKNPADAEDVLQEVFCKRLYRAPAFASPDHERRWLFRVALNQCRDALRSTWEEHL